MWSDRDVVGGRGFRPTARRSVVQIIPRHQDKDKGSDNAPLRFSVWQSKSYLSSHWLTCPASKSPCRDPSSSSATCLLQALQRCAPLKSGLPHEGQRYLSHSARAHSMLPSSSPQAVTFARHMGIVLFITRRPVARGKF